jgi:hypothetical protein
MLFGFATLTVPTAPAARYIFQRSSADPKWACSGPGNDFGVERDASEVVDAALGDVQPVADEDERGLHGRGRIDAQSDVGILAERQRLGLSASNQRQARLGFEDASSGELDRLNVSAAGAGRLEARFLELGSDVFGRAFVRRAAGVPALHGVVGERLHVRPPAGGGVVGAEDRAGENEREKGRDETPHDVPSANPP